VAKKRRRAKAPKGTSANALGKIANVVKVRRKFVMLTPSQFIAAVKGSRGIIKRISERAGTTWTTIYNILHKKTRACKAWDRAREAYEEECQLFDDDAEDTIHDAMGQRIDIATAGRTAIAYVKLRKRMAKRGWADQTRMVHEGGENPINIHHQTISVDMLDLPLEVRKAILDATEKYYSQKRTVAAGTTESLSDEIGAPALRNAAQQGEEDGREPED
jgi:hypothetical protein